MSRDIAPDMTHLEILCQNSAHKIPPKMIFVGTATPWLNRKYRYECSLCGAERRVYWREGFIRNNKLIMSSAKGVESSEEDQEDDHASSSPSGMGWLVAAFVLLIIVGVSQAPRHDSGILSSRPESQPLPQAWRQVRQLSLSIAPYFPQHVQFDDADRLLVRNRQGVAILLNGHQISDCYEPDFSTSTHGMYTFASCGGARATIDVAKYVWR